MNIVICGKNGKLGSALINYLSKNHRIIGLGREDLDLCDQNALRKTSSTPREFSLVLTFSCIPPDIIAIL